MPSSASASKRIAGISDDTVPRKYQGLLQRVKDEQSKSKAEAIKAMCLERIGSRYRRIIDCASPKYPLLHVRPYPEKVAA